jgi:TAG lipase/lysophosphatidylethanolamine acyltransferase
MALRYMIKREVQMTNAAVVDLINRCLYYFIHTIYAKHKSYKINQDIKMAETYEQWENLALDLDKLYEKHKWKADPRSQAYDYRNVEYLYKFLLQFRTKGLTKGLIHTLRCSLQKNMYGIANPALYEKSYTGTKYLVEKFQREIINSLHSIHDDPDLSLADK